MTARRKAKRNLARAIIDCETQRDFVFRRILDTVTAAAGDTFVLLPTTFMAFGKYGDVSLGQDQPPVEEKSLEEITRFQLDNPARTGKIRYWAKGGMDATTGQHSIQIWPKPLDTTTIYLAFMRRPPIPHDAGDAADTDDDELFLFPEVWHDTLIYESVVMRQMKDKANQQSAGEQRGLVEDWKRRMVIQEDVLKSKPNTIAGWGSRMVGRNRI